MLSLPLAQLVKKGQTVCSVRIMCGCCERGQHRISEVTSQGYTAWLAWVIQKERKHFHLFLFLLKKHVDNFTRKASRPLCLVLIVTIRVEEHIGKNSEEAIPVVSGEECRE